MLRLVRRDVGHGREDVRTVRGRSLDAVSVVDSAFARFLVNVKVREVVVEVDRSSAEVSTEEGRVRSAAREASE